MHQAHEAVADDQHHREDGVAGERRAAALLPEHHGGDQRHLDHRHRDGEDEGAVGLAEPMGDELGMVHGGEHGAE